MSRDAGRKLLTVALRHVGEQDALLAEIQALCRPEESIHYRQMIGDSRHAIVSEVVEPIVAKYPELRPPQSAWHADVRPAESDDGSNEHSAMSRDAARKVLDTIIRHHDEQEAALVEVRAQCSEEEFSDYQGMFAQSIGAMFLDVIAPIVGKYPELTPPQLKT